MIYGQPIANTDGSRFKWDVAGVPDNGFGAFAMLSNPICPNASGNIVATGIHNIDNRIKG